MNFFNSLGKYLRTIQYLKLVQIIYRLKSIISTPRIPDINGLGTVKLRNFQPKVSFLRSTRSILGENKFIFINETCILEFPEDWNYKKKSTLWNYNLHYFDGLMNDQTPLKDKEAFISRWIADNSGEFSIGWEPYPLSMRVSNWIKWSWLNGLPLTNEKASSLFQQAKYLETVLEYHLLGNHLLENSKALIFAGCIFIGKDAERWLSKGCAILKKELNEQILEDGGHFELSPMYHCLMLELVLDILTISHDDSAPETLKKESKYLTDIAHKMSRWLVSMTHPDGEISFFNDSAIGIAKSPTDLLKRASSLTGQQYENKNLPICYLKDTGYTRLSNKDAVLLFDVAEIGPSYLPGHGHADTLSIEFSIYNQRLIVNTGTSEYGLSERRDFERSTKAHSTLEICGLNSSEVWSGFRVGRRARPHKISISENMSAQASHNGYRYLRSNPTHTRKLSLSDSSLNIEDTVNGIVKYSFVYFNIHPQVKVEQVKDLNEGFFILPCGSRVLWKSLSDKTFIKESLYAQNFGNLLPMQTIVQKQQSNQKSSLIITW